MTRILPTSLVLLLCSALARLAQAKDLPGANWCGELMCVTAFINDSTTITCKTTKTFLMTKRYINQLFYQQIKWQLWTSLAGWPCKLNTTLIRNVNVESKRTFSRGFGTQMSDAKMILMWPNLDQSVSLSQRTAPGEVEPSPDSNPPRNATLYQPLTVVRHRMYPNL